MAEIYLVRHAQASFHSDDYDQLSELGLQQSHWLGEYLAQQDLRFEHCVVGSLRRHRQTLDACVAGAGLSWPSPRCLAGLDEYDFRALVDAYVQQWPAQELVQQLEREPGSKTTYYRLLRRVLECWATGELQAPGVETWQAFRQRVAAVLQTLQEECSSGERYLLVSSGGAIAAFIGRVLDLAPEKVFDLNLQMRNTGITQFFFNRRKISLTGFNAVPHLQVAGRHGSITYG